MVTYIAQWIYIYSTHQKYPSKLPHPAYLWMHWGIHTKKCFVSILLLDKIAFLYLYKLNTSRKWQNKYFEYVMWVIFPGIRMTASSLGPELMSFTSKSFTIMSYRFSIGFRSGLLSGWSFIKGTMQSSSHRATDFAVWEETPSYKEMLALVSSKESGGKSHSSSG